MTDARPDHSSNLLSSGDTLARAGHWPAAIEAWQRVANEHSSLGPDVERRLEWFLAEAGGNARRKPRILPLVGVFLAATVLGMVFLMVAGTPGSLAANLWAGAAWVMIAAATAAALLAAHRSGETSLSQLVSSAGQAADRLERIPVEESLHDHAR